MSNTDNTLPAELTPVQIFEKYRTIESRRAHSLNANYDFSYLSQTSAIAAMEEYSNAKLHLLQQEHEALQRWKEEAKTLLTPIFEYGQDHPDMKLGGSMVEFVLSRCREYDKLKGENEKTCHALANLAKQYKASNDLATEHKALKQKAEKMAGALRRVISHGDTLPYVKDIADAALSSYNSNTNQNENNG